jgi:hypothetical protein
MKTLLIVLGFSIFLTLLISLTLLLLYPTAVFTQVYIVSQIVVFGLMLLELGPKLKDYFKRGKLP